MKNQSVSSHIDWVVVSLYIAMVVMGWLNIYSSSLSTENVALFDTSQYFGKQLLFIVFSVPLIIVVLSVDAKIYEKFAVVFYAAAMLLEAGLYVFGKEVKGQVNWYAIGSFSLQPAEFAKAATALALAKFLSDIQINLKTLNRQLQALAIIFLPVILIAPHDPGSALIYFIFVFVLYREGLPPWYLWTGFIAIFLFVLTLVVTPNVEYLIGFILIMSLLYYWKSRIIDRNILFSTLVFVAATGFVLSVTYVFENIFEQHHRDRFNVLLGKAVDMKGIGYNINQSKIAIGSGKWFGKGFLEGTQTKGGFVPEQHSDYIFTTVGEEWGFFGSLIVVAIFVGLIFRILYLAERQKTKFSRIYAYSVAAILFVHFFVNISMVLGIFPTVGVPLPLFSYGGSSLWGFTILIFIFIKLDANKVNEW